jgi:hypothetical protein
VKNGDISISIGVNKRFRNALWMGMKDGAYVAEAFLGVDYNICSI